MGGGMTKKIRENAIYITQLPPDVTTDKMAELFGSIGVIKVCVWNLNLTVLTVFSLSGC